MSLKHIVLFVALSSHATTVGAQGSLEPSLIPQPVSLSAGSGVFHVTSQTRVVATADARGEASKLIALLAPAMGFRLMLAEVATQSAIVLSIDPNLAQALGDEGYTLNVTPRTIDLRAARPAGLFYAIQTLRQLLPPRVLSPTQLEGVDWAVPCVAISDHPRFGWRGLLIDPARHFIPVEDVKRFIDAMVLHKFNRLQMHLTDNEGWRIQIKKYPKLTEIGSQMDWTFRRKGGTEPRCSGFYSQDDIRELVRYAADRYVTIVPEIEMPYHTGSAIVSYPELGPNPDQFSKLPIDARWRECRGLLAPRSSTVSFMQDVLAEVIALFPSRFIHIGGDEANLGLWEKDPEMQAWMKGLGCRNAHELHSWFIRQQDEFLTKHGRRLIGWDEILQGGLAAGATVMSWRGESGGITAAQAGHDVIMAPTSHTYFDYYQGPRDKEPLAIGGHIPVEKVYEYEPVPASLNVGQSRHVLGAQAQLWGEFIPNRKHLAYMTYPRAAAFSETVWSPWKDREFDLFLIRLEHHLKRLDAARVHYRPLDQKPVRWPGKTDRNAPHAARELLERLLPAQADRFVFEVIPPEQGRDVFEIESRAGKLVVRGNSGVSMAMGLNWYLKHYCHGHVSWFGRQLGKLSPGTQEAQGPLPKVEPKVRRVTWAKHRYFLNYCCFGYSLPWWNWEQWEQLIDWMALNGVNMPLSVTGQEAVWQAVGQRLGLSGAQIEAFLAGPPYLPFGWMGCLDGWGGPLPASWIDRHEALQKRILARQRALGMTPVLQGFTGHVPSAVTAKFPDAKTHKIHWIEWETHLLDPLDPLFTRVAGLFMEEQARRFGTDHLYAADTFIEMTPPSGDLKYLDRLARAIYGGMAQTDPNAVWVLQGWAFMYRSSFWTQPRLEAFLDGVPSERMVVLDLFCESTPMWSRSEAFCGKPWLWCNVQNFGGTVFLGGRMDRNNAGLAAARRARERGMLIGLGFVNEALGYNAPVYDHMFEMAWRNGAVDLNSWFTDYATYRYGQANGDAEAAWRILHRTVYTAPHGTHSIICRVPSLKPAGGVAYDNVQLAAAWRSLLHASDALGNTDTYRFDLVNLARQVLSNHAGSLQHNIAEAHRSKNVDAYQAASDKFLHLIRDLDELLATRREFLLGRCLADARRWGANDVERAKLEWNARRVLTLWGTKSGVRDYARKEWSGMFTGFYLKRWEWYLREVGTALAEQRPLDSKAFDQKLWEWERDWADGDTTYPSEESGDSVAVATKLWAKYNSAFKPDAMSLTTGKPISCSSSLPPNPAQLANDGYASNTDRYWATDVQQHPGPAWCQIDLVKATTVGRVVVVGYYGDNRHYGFTVETSVDGKAWDMAADYRDNKELSTAPGYTVRFAPRSVRYLRVTQTSNSANAGRHLVEVMAYAQ